MLRLIPLLALTLLVAACTPYTNATLGFKPVRMQKPLVELNYDAVDKLMSRAGARVKKDTPMIVGTIADVNDVETSSTLGRAITEQVGSRLAMNGYKVAEMKLRQGISIQGATLNPANSGEYIYSRDARDVAGQHKAAVAVSGTYAVSPHRVMVNLRLIDIRTGRLITAYDYILPHTEDIRGMLVTPEANNGASFFGNSWAY